VQYKLTSECFFFDAVNNIQKLLQNTVSKIDIDMRLIISFVTLHW